MDQNPIDLSSLPAYVPAHTPLTGIAPEVPPLEDELLAPAKPEAPLRAIDLIRPDTARLRGIQFQESKRQGLIPKSQTPRGGCAVKTGHREAARRLRQMARTAGRGR